jgi:hypothetical protein
MERQTALQVWVTPRSVLTAMDVRDGLQRGATEKALRFRAQRPTTPLETYLSFNDYFGLSFGSSDAELEDEFGPCEYVAGTEQRSRLDGVGPLRPCPWSRSLFKPFDKRDPATKYPDQFGRTCSEINAQTSCPLFFCDTKDTYALLSFLVCRSL